MRYVREMAVFEVEDTGPGIPADQLEHIFEPFARGTETTGSGTGLGLTISKMLTDLMGGEMSVSSTVGEGTLFRIRLFLPGARGAAVAQEVTRAARVGYRGPRRRILVVDNEEVDRALLASVLEPLGFELLQAASGHQCLEIVSAFRPDAVLMDLAMPGIDGWATIRAMRAQRLTDAPVAIVSGNAFDKELDNDVGVRPEDFVLKPVRVNELLDWLGTRLGLDWIEAAGAEQPAPAVMPHWVLPSLAQLQGLQELVALGYLRGIQRKLDEIEGENAAHGSFVAHLRGLARNFQLDALTAILTKSIHDRQAS